MSELPLGQLAADAISIVTVGLSTLDVPGQREVTSDPWEELARHVMLLVVDIDQVSRDAEERQRNTCNLLIWLSQISGLALKQWAADSRDENASVTNWLQAQSAHAQMHAEG